MASDGVQPDPIPQGQTSAPTPTSPQPPPPPGYLANNLLYSLKYNAGRSTSDTLKRIISSHFKQEDIATAYTLCKEFIPQTLIPDRRCKLNNAQALLNLLVTWFQTETTSLPEIFADEPYALPPANLKDVGEVTIYNIAKNAMEASNRNGEMFQEEISKIYTGFLDMSNLLREEIANLKSQILCLSESLQDLPKRITTTHMTRPPSPGEREHDTTPAIEENRPNAPPPGEGETTGTNSLPQVALFPNDQGRGERSQAAVPTNPPSRGESVPPPTPTRNMGVTLYSAAASTPQPHLPPPPHRNDNRSEDRNGTEEPGGEGELEGEWRYDGHSNRDRRRRRLRSRRNNARRNPSTPHRPAQDGVIDRQKRCHRVIHNLHRSVRLDDIKNIVNSLTGADPLIIQELPCKRRGKTAFRITCLYDHAEKLIGENFGTDIRVSRYNYKRDFPIGRLREIPRDIPREDDHTPPGRSATPTAPPQGSSTPTSEAAVGNFIRVIRDNDGGD